MANSPEYNRRYRDKYPERRLAHSRVNWAIRTGRLERKPCERCGNAESHAHHDDYAKPLDVRWLCSACHEDEHHGPRPPRPPAPPTNKQLRSPEAKRLRAGGLSYREIGQRFGITQGTAYKWINDPSYK